MSGACHCAITSAAPMSLRMRRAYGRMMNALYAGSITVIMQGSPCASEVRPRNPPEHN